MSYMTQFDINGGVPAVLTLTPDIGLSPVSPVAGTINLIGGDLITTVGSVGTVTIDLDNGTNGQVIIGGGLSPAWAALTSTGGTITFTPGANTLNLETAGSVATQYNEDVGSAVPVLGVLTIVGGTGISTAGAGSTVTITNDDPASALTLTGDTGGALSPTAGNWNIVSANTTVPVAGAVSTLTLDFGIDNLMLGSNGSAITTGNFNTCFGNKAGQSITTAEENTLIGWEAGTDITTSQNNTAIGSAALWRATSTSEENVAIGNASLQAITTGSNKNTAVGTFALYSLASTGSYNVVIGWNGAGAYTTTESSNIAINSFGVIGDSNTLRIGESTGAGNQQLNAAYICGIDGVNVGSVAEVVTMGTGGAANQLGSAVITAGTGISVIPGANTITIASTIGSPVMTLTGNSGGAISPTAGNINVITANATPTIVGAGSTLTLDFGVTNLFIGDNGSSITTGSTNIGYGIDAGGAITSGSDNAFVGYGAGRSYTTGSNSTAVGIYSMYKATTASGDNSALGGYSLHNITSNATRNTAVGYASLYSLAGAANYNVSIGYNSSGAYTTTESSNICINSYAVIADSNTLRIGESTGAGNQSLNKAYICGIDGVNVGSVAEVVTMASDQLGTATITAGTAISVTPGANTITIAATGLGAFAWAVITANQTAVVNNGYICNKAGTLDLALPATGAIGDIIEVTGINTAAGWKITQSANQQIFYGISFTTVGVTGTITSSAIRDSVRMVCVVSGASTVWNVISGIGTPIIV